MSDETKDATAEETSTKKEESKARKAWTKAKPYVVGFGQGIVLGLAVVGVTGIVQAGMKK